MLIGVGEMFWEQDLQSVGTVPSTQSPKWYTELKGSLKDRARSPMTGTAMETQVPWMRQIKLILAEAGTLPGTQQKE